MERPKIIVVGAGYAGMAFLKNLDESVFKRADVMLINKNSYHYHSTMLHKVATAERCGKIMFDLHENLHPEVKILQAAVVRIDPEAQEVTTTRGTFSYDKLICAAGFEIENFNLPGIENALWIDAYSQAARICELIKTKFDRALDDGTGLNVVVCGGGLTGIEFAASCAKMLARKCDFHGVSVSDRARFTVRLISSTPRLLPFFSEKLSQKALKRLEALGVEVVHKTRISSLTPNHVHVKEGPGFPSDLTVWTAGVRGASVVTESEIANERGRVKVDGQLRSVDDLNTFYIGDVSAVHDSNGKLLPPTAQLACEQGAFLARLFEAQLNHQPFKENFSFKSQGIVCSIGHNYAVAQILGVEMSGWLPAKLKTLVEKRWNAKVMGWKGWLV